MSRDMSFKSVTEVDASLFSKNEHPQITVIEQHTNMLQLQRQKFNLNYLQAKMEKKL